MFRDAVKAACSYGGTSITAVAAKIGTTQQNLTNGLKREKYGQRKIQAIAEAIGCEYQAYFEFSDGSIIGKENVDMQLKIRTICAFSGVKLQDLAIFINISQPSLTSRLKTDAMYQKDLQKIADFCGCKYVSRFIFPDGHIINTNG